MKTEAGALSLLKEQQEGQSGQRRGVTWTENGSERAEGQRRESMLILELGKGSGLF